MDSAIFAIHNLIACALILATALSLTLLVLFVSKRRRRRQMREAQEQWANDPLNYR